jgi:chromosome segregation ATPase
MAIVSISHAAKLVRKGRQTLYNHNDKGKLSFTQTEDGKPGIDTSELERVYGKLYMPAKDVETVVQDSSGKLDTVGQLKVDSVSGGKGVQNKLSKAVSLDSDTVSTLSWFMEQVDEAKQELADTQAELVERERSLAELRKAMASLPSPESVERRLTEQADRLKQQHNKTLEAERNLQIKVLAEQKQHEAQQAEKWQQSIAERRLEIQQARAETDEIRQREKEQIRALKAERDRLVALESRGFIARLLNRKPTMAG